MLDVDMARYVPASAVWPEMRPDRVNHEAARHQPRAVILAYVKTVTHRDREV